MKRAAPALAGLALARLLLHALAWPAFEGPDEPFHLARALAHAASPFAAGPAERALPAAVSAAVSGHPCGTDLARVFGCRPFPGGGALFGLLQPAAGPAPAVPVPYYEVHHPPAYYVLAGLLLRLLGPLTPSPEAQLLALRLVSVALVAWALLGPVRRLASRRGAGLLAASAAALLLPGAAEALARGSNDALVFLWTALVVERLDREDPGRGFAALLALGPMTKLTALPVAVVVVVELWRRGRVRGTVAAACATLVVFPVQLLRGWAWGGTLEATAPATGGAAESAVTFAVGLGRTVYTFLKTAIWLGGWSFFRAPLGLVLAAFAVAIVVALALRARRPAARVPSHLAGLGAAVAGFLAFAVGNRRYYGTWGGVGGWYLWSWFPWLLLAADDLLEARSERAGRLAAVLCALFLVVANALWIRAALALYL